MASRYDDLFNKMTNGTNYMDKVNGSGYSESKKNFGYNTEGKQLYDLNKKSPDSYTPAPGYSNDDSMQTFKNAGNNASKGNNGGAAAPTPAPVDNKKK